MKSFQIEDYCRPLIERDNPTPKPKCNEVLIAVGSCGVCHSDIHIWEGFFDLGDGKKTDLTRAHRLPLTLGHEIAGTIAAVGENANGRVGDRVVVYPWIGCGACAVCKLGEDNLCPKPRNLGVHLNGGYSTHVLVPDGKYLFPIGDLPMNLAATYACSGITAFGALKKIQSRAEGRNLLIIGAGGVGLAALNIAQVMMDTVIIVADTDPVKRQAARSAGAAHALDPNEKNAQNKLYKLSNGGIHAAIDFVGSSNSTAFGFDVLAAQGHMAIVGLFGGAAKLSVPLFPLKSLSVMGSYVGTLGQFEELMELASDGKFSLLPIEERPLCRAQSALEDLAKGKIVGRVVLSP